MRFGRFGLVLCPCLHVLESRQAFAALDEQLREHSVMFAKCFCVPQMLVNLNESEMCPLIVRIRFHNLAENFFSVFVEPQLEIIFRHLGLLLEELRIHGQVHFDLEVSRKLLDSFFEGEILSQGVELNQRSTRCAFTQTIHATERALGLVYDERPENRLAMNGTKAAKRFAAFLKLVRVIINEFEDSSGIELLI